MINSVYQTRGSTKSNPHPQETTTSSQTSKSTAVYEKAIQPLQTQPSNQTPSPWMQRINLILAETAEIADRIRESASVPVIIPSLVLKAQKDFEARKRKPVQIITFDEYVEQASKKPSNAPAEVPVSPDRGNPSHNPALSDSLLKLIGSPQASPTPNELSLPSLLFKFSPENDTQNQFTTQTTSARANLSKDF